MTGRERMVVLGTATVIVLGIVGAYLVYTLSNASYTLGCDYLTYDVAVRAWVAGASPYDLSITTTGECGTFQYPPAFLLPLAPLALLPPGTALWVWIALSVACLLGAMALMPVSVEVRLVTLMLAGTSWPVLFAIKVGALGPLLLLVFAAAWRWRDRPGLLGVTVAAGSLAKLQPALLLGWMALTGRRRAALVGMAVIALTVGGSLLLDAQAWFDFATVIRTLSGSAVDVPANVAPASVALHLGLSADSARAVGAAHTLVILGLVALAAWRIPADGSVLVAAVASQVVAPVMWDHYAAVVFLPVAWLLARRQWWALAVGAAFNAMLVLVMPSALTVVLLDITMPGMVLVGWRDRAGSRGAAPGVATAAP